MLRRVSSLFIAGLIVTLSAAVARGHPHEAPPTSAQAPLFDLGTWRRPVTTTSAEAQTYFDQGLNLVYAFNHAQAIESFRQAARLDSNCAMAYWGVALALGPNINMPMEASAEPQAWEAQQKALALARGASEPERAFIRALAKRYADPKDASRPSRAALDSAYAGAMREVWRQYPTDVDAGALFAEAAMDLTPWNYWGPDGRALRGTEEIVASLEAVLESAPNHPGANHYYIHAVEARHPERAIPAAERLTHLVPDAGHLVHMPSHIWHRVGRYAEAEEANVRAARVDSLYVAKHNPQSVYPMMYYPHNVHFIWSAACMEGRRGVAIAAARRLESLWNPEMVRQMPFMEFLCPTSFYAQVRFGRWTEILKEPAPPAHMRYTTGMWHYARGLAFAATGRLPQARVAHDSVVAIAAATPPDALVSFNSPAALLRLAGHTLAGEIAARGGKSDEAVQHFQQAIKEEAALRYDEPPAWYLPVRQQLGAVLLAAGHVAEAEIAYREDLAAYPENGWSLYGLAKCLRLRKADGEAAKVEQRFRKAWARSDVKLASSRF